MNKICFEITGSKGIMVTKPINPEPSSNIQLRGSYGDQPIGVGGYHRITLRCPQGYNNPYGYGLRVVGQHVGDVGEENVFPQQAHVSTFARVLWLSPGGVAESAGMNVGDRVCTIIILSIFCYLA